LTVQLVSKISNLCDPDPPTLQTDRQTDGRTTRNLNTALCTSASRGKKQLCRDKNKIDNKYLARSRITRAFKPRHPDKYGPDTGTRSWV